MSDFLVYAYLQTAKDADAKQIVDSLPNLKKFRFASLGIDTALAAIPARFALERGRWDDAAQLPVRDSQFPAAQSISYFARALGTARSGNAAAARAEIASPPSWVEVARSTAPTGGSRQRACPAARSTITHRCSPTRRCVTAAWSNTRATPSSAKSRTSAPRSRSAKACAFAPPPPSSASTTPKSSAVSA
jgi:hypothetical protein